MPLSMVYAAGKLVLPVPQLVFGFPERLGEKMREYREIV